MAETIVISELPNVKWKGFTETANDLIITRVFTGQTTPNNSRDTLRGLRESEISNYGYYSGHRILVGAGNGKGGQYDVMELTTVELNVSMDNGYYSTFTAANNATTLPLERKTIESGDTDATYLTWWNYDVRGKKGLAALTEDNKTTIEAITNGKMDATLNAVGYYFAKTNQARKESEEMYLPAGKPGVQSFIFPTLTVQENIYARDKSTVQAAVDAIGFLKFPENHVGDAYDDNRKDSKYWLIVDASYKKVFGWYEATVKYKYANQGWDTDLYAYLDPDEED